MEPRSMEIHEKSRLGDTEALTPLGGGGSARTALWQVNVAWVWAKNRLQTKGPTIHTKHVKIVKDKWVVYVVWGNCTWNQPSLLSRTTFGQGTATRSPVCQDFGDLPGLPSSDLFLACCFGASWHHNDQWQWDCACCNCLPPSSLKETKRWRQHPTTMQNQRGSPFPKHLSTQQLGLSENRVYSQL